MARITEQKLKEQIKNKNFSSLYFLYGEESYLVKHYASKIVEGAVPKGMEAFNLHLLDGEKTTPDEIFEKTETMPMMAERICVSVKDMDLGALGQKELDKIYEIIKDVPETCVLIFWYSADNDDKKSAKWKNVIKKFTDCGEVFEAAKMSQPQLASLVKRMAKKQGCDISDADASYLAGLTGGDMNTLFSETEKLCFYAQGGEITRKKIDEIAVKSVEASVFDLVKAIAAGKSEKAFSVLNLLFSQKTEPVMILGAIIGSYCDMYRVRAAKNAGQQPTDVANYYGYKGREFRLRNAARDSASLSDEALRRCLQILWDCDALLKSSRTDNRLALEETVVKLLLASGGEKV